MPKTAYTDFGKYMKETFPEMDHGVRKVLWREMKKSYIRDNGTMPRGLSLSDFMPFLESSMEAIMPSPSTTVDLMQEAPVPTPSIPEAPAPPPPLFDIYPKRNQMYGDELDYTLPSKDPTERAQILTKLMNDDEFVDDLGQPLPKEAILQIAMLQPIWGRLTPSQRKMFLEDKGVLPNGRGYISKTVVPYKPDKPKVKLLNRLGETIVI